MSLSKLPRELILAVADTLPTDSLSRFLRTCQSIHQLLAPALTARITTEDLALCILKWAIGTHNLPTVQLALSHNAPWHSVTGNCYSAFQEACNLNHLDTVTALLIHFGPTIISSNSMPGGDYCHACPFENALRQRNLPLTKLLLEHGAPANRTNFRGYPSSYKQPLDFAGKYGTGETAKVLIQHGANVRGATRALSYAMDHGRWEVARVLLRGGVDVWTPSFAWSDSCPLGNRTKEEIDAWVAAGIEHRRRRRAESSQWIRTPSEDEFSHV